MHNLKPKKFWGQHFLIDQEIAMRIVNSLQAETESQVVEIGPGQGVLTQYLQNLYPKLKVVEIDPAARDYLQKHLALPEEQIIHQDVLRWDLQKDIAKDTHFIGNLPYNISSPFFFMLLENLTFVQSGVFMIQEEVARRICAPPGNKTYGILSVLLGAYFELEYLFAVPPEVFRPPPKVMSGVIRIRRKDELPELSFSTFKQVVKQAFGKRRKTLRNALKGLVFTDAEELEEVLGRRAETLTVQEFLRLAQRLK